MPGRFSNGQPVDAAIALPIGFLGMLLIGAGAVAWNGSHIALGVLVAACLLVGVLSYVAQPVAAAPLAVIGWFTVAGFARHPLGDLHLHGTFVPAIVLLADAALAATLGAIVRDRRAGNARTASPAAFTLDAVRLRWHYRPASGVSRGRVLAGFAMAVVALPAITALLSLGHDHPKLIDDLLIYLLAVVAVTILGGFWPAVFAAISAGLLLNWFFTPPLHTWTIDAPSNLLALLLFVTTAVTVSSVVHQAARRHAVAVERAAEADALLDLARTVLGGDDSPQSVLDHLAVKLGLLAELQERTGNRWVRIAGSGGQTDFTEAHVIPAGENLRLLVFDDISEVNRRLLDGYAAQAAAACERQRLRIQAGQTEALSAANRMRTALLAAVSHDLRTPLASVKAAVSTLRQTDIDWTDEDRASLHATIEEGADRLAELIGNLLDMSRIHTGALQPVVRPIALDEVVPLVTRGLEDGARVVTAIPDDLPLVRTDPVLLERSLANLVANALRYSPPGQPPTVSASAAGKPPTISAPAAGKPLTVTILVVDHGPGIPVDQRDRVFEPFQQLGDHRQAAGVGLGLAVAKGFIESVGGSISAESTPGGGLTMRVELPVAPAHERADTRQ